MRAAARPTTIANCSTLAARTSSELPNSLSSFCTVRAPTPGMESSSEVSCRELDVMVDAAEGLPGFHGGRMTGGGFGGCTLNLVEAPKAEEFARLISERYQAETGIRPEIYICSAGDGAGPEGF